MILYSIFSILVAIVLIYSSIGMYKDKLIKSAITTDVLSLILIGLAVCGFIISEDYHKYIIFSMLGIVISLVLVYYLSNKKNPKKTK
jgi:hypothetical protein